eukprot:TRINITY_DN23214_c0_g2_i1.p2 TRINITY_DN23214_c0_g2~~TRINITY_DN23214_c0_g2_i1.p2  ORF type:complete len:177 (-),score=63.60 TRINITY_DN23214_c0_g2_i1:10-540(-)
MMESSRKFSEEIRELKKTKFLLEDLIAEREIKTKEYTLALVNREKNAFTPAIELLESLVSDTHKELSKKIMSIRSGQDISNNSEEDLANIVDKLNTEKRRNEECKNSIRRIQEKLIELSSSESRIIDETETKMRELAADREKRLNRLRDEVMSLSLIHICRCRRYAVCRSRWSPYH